MIYAVSVILFGALGYSLYKELTNAPEGWLCSYCHNEVQGLEFCPYCGIKKQD